MITLIGCLSKSSVVVIRQQAPCSPPGYLDISQLLAQVVSGDL
jgi:hypothetical protein